MSNNQLKALIKNLGGKEKVRDILHDFYLRMSRDTMIGYFFKDKDPLAIADHQLDFFLFAAGINPTYSGKKPRSAHTKLPPIFIGHFQRRLILLENTLRDHHIEDTSIQTWIKFEASFKKAIIA